MSQGKLHRVALPTSAEPTSSERFTRTLVELTRTLWNPVCSFDSAMASICAAAASALQVERVSIWRYDADSGRLDCINAFDAASGLHHDADSLETLLLEDDDYISALRDARTFEASQADESVADLSHPALFEYMERHDIVALLDAPAYIEGKLQGVICHESIGRSRKWTREETTFAATMGDFVAMAYEIVRRRRAETEVEHLRLHDATTGLGNRDYLVELIRQRLNSSSKPGQALAVVHILVDPSGGIAWSAGAPTVDDVMTQIGHRLRWLVDGSIELARVRDNGFALLLPGDSQQRGAVRLAERALAVIRSLEWNHDEVDPSAWAGIVFAQGEQDFDDPRVLMRKAEEAAEHARSGDKFGFTVFDPEHHETLLEALRYERALRDAFANGEFELHYQPEFDAHLRQWVAAESLLRWRKGDRLVVAGEFIGVVESSGLMLPVGRWVLSQACRDAVKWPARNGGSYVVRVNVSARQFDEEGLVDDVTSALAESGLEPSRLCLELTETTLMRDIDRALGLLQQLRQTGVQLAIDDFGTGYGSLVYLKRLPVDVLKIDRSFVEDVPDDAANTAIVKAVVALAQSFQIDVIAEGVERVEQEAALQAIGVSRMQGWLYGKAMDQASLRGLLAAPPPEAWQAS